jgi:hypothetical protein
MVKEPDWETLKLTTSMSGGPGKVQRILMAMLADNPCKPFDTTELCKAVYGVAKVEKRHRVAVIRALKRLACTCMPELARRVQKLEKASDIWFDRRSFQAMPSASAGAGEPRPPRTR